MTDQTRPAPPCGILGVFFVLFGAGMIFDASQTLSGTGLIALGTYLLSRTRSDHDGATA